MWASFDDYDGDDARFRAAIDALAAELPDGDPDAMFERAGAWDSTGHSDVAVPLYEQALERGLSSPHRRQAVIQLASSLRNLGRAEESVALLQAERDTDPRLLDPSEVQLADAVSAFLALALVDVGRKREAVSIALGALGPRLPRYQRSVANYARLLVERDDDSE